MSLNTINTILDNLLAIFTAYSEDLKSTNFLCFSPRSLEAIQKNDINDEFDKVNKATCAAIHSILRCVYLKNRPEGHLMPYTYTKEEADAANIRLNDCSHGEVCPMVIGHSVFLWYEHEFESACKEQLFSTGCGFYHAPETVNNIRTSVFEFLKKYDSPKDNNEVPRTFYMMQKIFHYINSLTPEHYDLLGFVPKKLLCLAISPVKDKDGSTRLRQVCNLQYTFNDNIFLIRDDLETVMFQGGRKYTKATHKRINEINAMPYRNLIQNDELYNDIFHGSQARRGTWSNKFIQDNKSQTANNVQKYEPVPDFLSLEYFPKLESLVPKESENDVPIKTVEAKPKATQRVITQSDLPDLSIFSGK
jgi:hypothetical protein